MNYSLNGRPVRFLTDPDPETQTVWVAFDDDPDSGAIVLIGDLAPIL